MAANGRRVTEPSALAVRVDNLAEDVHGFRIDLHNVQERMATRADIAALTTAINTIASKQDAGSKPNWQAWGVAMTGIVALGALAYLPVREATTDLKARVERIEDRAVSQTIFASTRARFDKDMDAVESQGTGNRVAISGIQEQNRNLDRRLDAISNRLSELIRTGK